MKKLNKRTRILNYMFFLKTKKDKNSSYVLVIEIDKRKDCLISKRHSSPIEEINVFKKERSFSILASRRKLEILWGGSFYKKNSQYFDLLDLSKRLTKNF